jgi:hypothetical protein
MLMAMLILIGKMSIGALLVALLVAAMMQHRGSERFGLDRFSTSVVVVWLLAMMAAGPLLAGWLVYVIHGLRNARWGI